MHTRSGHGTGIGQVWGAGPALESNSIQCTRIYDMPSYQYNAHLGGPSCQVVSQLALCSAQVPPRACHAPLTHAHRCLSLTNLRSSPHPAPVDVAHSYTDLKITMFHDIIKAVAVLTHQRGAQPRMLTMTVLQPSMSQAPRRLGEDGRALRTGLLPTRTKLDSLAGQAKGTAATGWANRFASN